MDEADGAIEVDYDVGNIVEVDLDAETAEEEVGAEPAESTSNGEADEDPQAADGEDEDPGHPPQKNLDIVHAPGKRSFI